MIMLFITIQYILRRWRPDFRLDAALDTRMLLSFSLDVLMAWMRGFKLLLLGLKPGQVFLGRGVRFRFASRIRLGQWVRLEDGVVLSAQAKEGIQLGDRVRIGAHSQLVVSTTLYDLGAHIRIGHQVGIGEFAYLGGAGGLDIGPDCIIGQYFSCHPENHHFDDPTQLIRLQGVSRKGIRIGANCWIGAKVTVLDGVTIGQGSVIAAGSVVTKDIPPYSVAAGTPARVIRSIHHVYN